MVNTTASALHVRWAHEQRALALARSQQNAGEEAFEKRIAWVLIWPQKCVNVNVFLCLNSKTQELLNV